jgi:hypothetical protein
MRRALPFLLMFTLVPSAAAEWGPYGADGWPIAVDGSSTNPYPGLTAEQFAAALAGEPLNQVAGATVFPYWPLLTAEVQRLASDHPDRVRLHSIGTSTLGLDLWMLEIADFANLDVGSGLPLAQREVVWVDGGHHSNEYSGVYFALAWAQFLVEEYGANETATWIVENRHTWIMPMVNPDGSNAFGRLNANGVNLNRNYPVIWDGVGNDALMNNRGPFPASEVETRLNIEWLNLTRPDYYASVHCCGNLWLYPYGEEGIDPVDDPMLRRVCKEAFPDVAEFCGPIWSTIYPASGSSVDTAYEYTGTVAFGYEMSGRGAAGLWGAPFTFDDVRTQEIESWTGLLHAFLNVHLYGAHPVITGVEADRDGLVVTVRNDGFGNLTGGTLSLQTATGAKATGPLPFLAPDERATVRLDGAKPGDYTLSLSYPKRLEATSNHGLQAVPLRIGSSGDAVPDGGFLAVHGDGGVLEAPGLGASLLLALGALAVALRRR